MSKVITAQDQVLNDIEKNELEAAITTNTLKQTKQEIALHLIYLDDIVESCQNPTKLKTIKELVGYWIKRYQNAPLEHPIFLAKRGKKAQAMIKEKMLMLNS